MKEDAHRLQFPPPLGISMSFNLKLMQLLQVEEVQCRQFPPPVWLMVHLTEEAQSLLFCRLRWRPGRTAADHSWCLISQILNTTLGSWRHILLKSNHKVLDLFMGDTLFSISPDLHTFSLQILTLLSLLLGNRSRAQKLLKHVHMMEEMSRFVKV